MGAQAQGWNLPFFIHTTPVMPLSPHWGTCVGPLPPDGYGPNDPHWEYNDLTDPATGRVAHLPISPCTSHNKHAHDFDGQENPHIASWNTVRRLNPPTPRAKGAVRPSPLR